MVALTNPGGADSNLGGDTVVGAAPLDTVMEHGVAWRGANVNQANHGTADNGQPNQTTKKMKHVMRDPVDGDGIEDVELGKNMDPGSLQIPEMPEGEVHGVFIFKSCLLYTSPSPRDGLLSRMPSSA